MYGLSNTSHQIRYKDQPDSFVSDQMRCIRFNYNCFNVWISNTIVRSIQNSTIIETDCNQDVLLIPYIEVASLLYIYIYITA